jgi:SAM-dependent methyltransferase
MLSNPCQVEPPDSRLTAVLEQVRPGAALDLACGSGRHARWLADRGWRVTGVDLREEAPAGIDYVRADLEGHEFTIEPNAWDLIVCWLYWQPDLLAPMAAGVREGGLIALAGKTTGRFATSLDAYRAAFSGWREIDGGQSDAITWLIARNVVRTQPNPFHTETA